MDTTLRSFDRIALAACLTVVVVTTGIASWHLYRQHTRIQAENSLLSMRSNDLDLAETSLQKLKSVLDHTRQELAILNARIPAAAEIGKFITQLHAIVARHAITLLSLKPGETVSERSARRIPIHMVFKGPFPDIYRLLQDMETMNRLVRIEMLTITKSDLEPLSRAELTVSVFERSEDLVQKLRSLI